MLDFQRDLRICEAASDSLVYDMDVVAFQKHFNPSTVRVYIERMMELERVLQLTVGYLDTSDAHEGYAFEQARKLFR